MGRCAGADGILRLLLIYPEIRKIFSESVLKRQTGITQILVFSVPVIQSTIVEQLE